MKATTINMTTGNAVKHILVFSVPLLIGNIFQQFYNLADSIIVGKFINADALAAIGVTSSITFLFFAICNGFASGGGILVSQSFGRGDTKEVKNYIANTGYIMILLPLFVGTLAFFLAGPILKMLDTPANIFDDARLYIRLMSIGLLFVSVYNYVSSIIKSTQRKLFLRFLRNDLRCTRNFKRTRRCFLCIVQRNCRSYRKIHSSIYFNSNSIVLFMGNLVVSRNCLVYKRLYCMAKIPL